MITFLLIGLFGTGVFFTGLPIVCFALMLEACERRRVELASNGVQVAARVVDSICSSPEGLRGLRAATGVTLMGNPSLRSLDGLDGLSKLRDIMIVESGVTSLHPQPSGSLSAGIPVQSERVHSW